MKKITRDELLASNVRLQDEVTALTLLVRSLTPSPGYHFVESKRGFNAYIIRVDDDGTPIGRYSSAIGSAERAKRNSDLWRLHADHEDEGWLLESLHEATKAEQDYLRRVLGGETAKGLDLASPEADEARKALTTLAE